MKGFVIYPTYKIVEDKAYVLLFGRLENGQSFLTINCYRPYFYIKKTDQDKAKDIDYSDIEKLKNVDFIDSNRSNFDNEPVVKVVLDLPENVPKLRKKFESEDIVCYEADIRFAYRFMMDNNIRSIMEIDESKTEQNNIIVSDELKKRVNQIYFEPKIHGLSYYDDEYKEKVKNYIIKPKILSIDIETDFKATQIFSISFYSKFDKEAKEVFILHDSVSDVDDIKVTKFNDEKVMLEAFIEKIIQFDPDIITGWNVIDFDFYVLFNRMKHYKLPLNFGRADWPARFTRQTSFLRQSTVNIPGRLVLDGIDLLKTSFVKLEDYKLNTAAKSILGDSKIDLDMTKVDINTILKNEPEKLIRYNLKDSKLVYDILFEKKIIGLSIERSLLTGMPLDRLRASVASLDSMYIRESSKMGFVCESIGNFQREERIKGAFVQEPIFGIHDNVLVFDFKSLYPSIMITFNIDPISFDKSGKSGEIVAPNNARFFNIESIIPKLIKDLWKNRDIAKKDNNELTSWAIKITMNSIYGVLANPSCRFYNTDIANAITAYAREIIKETSAKVEAMGYKVIYGDTDSLFVDANAKNTKDCENIAKEIKDKINKFYTELVKDKYGRDSALELQFEKVYLTLLLPKLRHASAGAKKRYAGLLKKEGKDFIDVVGMEIVRRDWTELAKSFQKQLLEKVFNKEKIDDYIYEFKEKLLAGKFNDLLIYKKAIRKPLDEYVKTTPPHIKAARQLDKLDSEIIEYVITENGPEPIQKQKSKIDYNHYIEKQIKPIADSILALFNKNFDDVIAKHKQSNLMDY